MATATITWTTNEAADSRVLYRLATAATWTDSTLRATALVTAHSVTLTGLTAGAAYAFQVRSRDAAGNLATASGTFTAAGTGPIVRSVLPAAAPAGTGSFTLTVRGTGFTVGTVVTWNGAPRSTTYVSAAEVRATILASDLLVPAAVVVGAQ